MKNKFIYSIVAAVVSSLLICGCSGDSKENQKAGTESSVSSSDAGSSATFNLTPRQYAKRFNKFSKELNLPFRLSPKVVKGEEQDTFKELFNKNVGMVGLVNKKTGKLSGVILIGSGDGTVDSGSKIIFSTAAAIAAANPDGKLSDVGKELVALINSSKDDTGKPSLKLINGVRVSYSQNDQIGNMFALAPDSD